MPSYAVLMQEYMRKRLLAKRSIESGCWRWTGAHDQCGYGRISVQGVNTPVHRIAWWTFVGNLDGLHVLHSCDNRDCFNPEHLHLGTHQDNMRERDDWGHGIRGERVSGARLSVEKVKAARKLRQQGLTWPVIAERFAVTPSTIRHAVTGHTWAHV